MALDCFKCENDACAMKTEKYAGTQPCYHCARASEERIDDACLICIAGHICCFVEVGADEQIPQQKDGD